MLDSQEPYREIVTRAIKTRQEREFEILNSVPLSCTSFSILEFNRQATLGYPRNSKEAANQKSEKSRRLTSQLEQSARKLSSFSVSFITVFKMKIHSERKIVEKN